MAIGFRTTRLAPSPTGALHLGHAHTFLITWWMARQAGASIIMRMEDLDVGRAKPESVQQAYDDLKWLGMDWDSHEVQSRRLSAYRDVLQQLWEKDALSVHVLEGADRGGGGGGGQRAACGDPNVRYPGTCALRNRAAMGLETIEEVAAAIGAPVCWRLRVLPGDIAFDDAIAGPQRFNTAAETGDFPLTRFDGTPAYQLACVVDDHAMGIDMVVRGDDLLSSTPRQMCVYRAMGWETPRFAHVPLVVGPDGKRLAKRHGESRIAKFRESGVSAEKIVGWVAWRSGQMASPREVSAGEMVQRFELAKLPRERVVLTGEDLEWLK